MWVINLLGLVLIIAIVWWFWLYKPENVEAHVGEVTIIVENGVYQPSRLNIAAGQPCDITFLRKDASPCASMVVFADLNLSEELPVNKAKKIHLPELKPGKYEFTCQMQMYRGELIVN